MEKIEKESDMALILVEDLIDRGWDVYQEVTLNGGICDIVACQGNAIWAIECKIAFGLPVLAQANRWISYANLVSVATVKGKSTDARRLGSLMAMHLGIGHIEVALVTEYDKSRDRRYQYFESPRTNEAVRPAYRRNVYDIRNSLAPEHKTFAKAGTRQDKVWTPFQATCKLLKSKLKSGPMTAKEAIDSLNGSHHYASEASARGSILEMARRGVIEGVKVIKVNGKYGFELSEDAKEQK